MANFVFNPPFASVVGNSDSTFARSLHHVDWVDGEDLVQASDTPDEQGLNGQFHVVENDFDALKADLANAYRLIRELRQTLAVALTQIQSELNKKTDKTKEGKDTKDGKETKEGKDGKETKEGKDGKEGKETKETKEHKDGKEGKETKEHKEKEGKESQLKEKDGPQERIQTPAPPQADHILPLDLGESPVGRAFIQLAERPTVGSKLLQDDR